MRTKSYTPSMSGNRYAYAAAVMAKQEVLHPYSHVFFKHGAVQNKPDVTAFIMDQLSLKAGLKKWGKKGRGGVNSDTNQLHIRDTFIPLHTKDLTKEYSKNILESHLFIKEKRYSTIKGRKVARGITEIDFISKECDIPPTVATE